MIQLKGEKIHLRALEPTDLDNLYAWENDPANWKVSHTQAPFSRFVLEQYLASAHEDIYTVKQLRLIIADNENQQAVGTIDLFEFDPNHLRAGIGILIAAPEDRRKGYAAEALKLLLNYCFETLNLHQLFCNIAVDNEPSILLFQKAGFSITGLKKEWNREGQHFKDELFLQLIHP